MISSTPLRKSINKKQVEAFTCTPLEGDDDHERRKRRSVYSVERSLSNIPEFSSVETLEQVTHHIKMCQKLFSENKINIRNAWEINVIDYMHQYVSKNKMVNFEVMLEGARTLEVCVKVYGCKVDYLSQEIIKLVNTKQATAEKENSIITEEDANTTVDKRTKQKRRRAHARPTVAKDKNSILTNEISKMVPNDFVGNIDINANNYQNMSTNKIPMDHAGYKFNLLNNRDHGFMSHDEKDPTLQEKLFLNIFPVIKALIICPEFKNFNVDEEDQAFNDSLVNIVNDRDKSRLSEHVNNEIVYDEDGMPIPELDGSIHDVFTEHVEPVEYEEGEVIAGQAAHKRIEMIRSFCPSDIPAERSEFTHSTINNSTIFLETVWVGPSHWKNKRIIQSAPRYSGKPEEKIAQVRRKKKISLRPQQQPIDLESSPDINFEKLCRASAFKCDVNKYTLPPNNLFTPSEFNQLMLRQLNPTREYQSEKTKESEFEHSPYDYDNADDSQYCSQIDLADINDNITNDKENDIGHEGVQNDLASDHIENGNDVDNDLPSCLNTEDALINAPDMVTQIYVPYAHRAKNINMKKLKSAMLECLMNGTPENNVRKTDTRP
ncbi:hypothetical protein Trydic_g5544, partial [Trypoxylus dichotomus]